MITAAIFGAGRIGKVHTHNVAGLAGVALRYVVDVNPAAASELAGTYGAKSATIEAALGDPEVNAVVIATSTDTHADLIQQAAAIFASGQKRRLSLCHSDVTANKRTICLVVRQVARENFSVL